MDDHGPDSPGLRKATKKEQRRVQATHTRLGSRDKWSRMSQKVRLGSRTIHGHLILSREISTGAF